MSDITKIGISPRELADTLIRECKQAVEKPTDPLMEEMIKEHGKPYCFALLLAAGIRGFNPDGAAFSINVDGKPVVEVPEGKQRFQ